MGLLKHFHTLFIGGIVCCSLMLPFTASAQNGYGVNDTIFTQAVIYNGDTLLTDLSIYQGKVLMKLINRETGNNCYEIIKEYKGGFNARLYQTVAFFFNSNLKQSYDPRKDDALIEKFVREVQRMYGYQDIQKPIVKVGSPG